MNFYKFTNIILGLVEKFKPLLIRLLPINFLRSAKKRFVASSSSSIRSETILPFNPLKGNMGVNLIGFIRAEIGLGQSCRLVANELNHSDFNFSVYNYQQVSIMRHNDDSWDWKITDHLAYNINLLHINPYELPIAFFNLGKQFWDGRYNIGFWLWELEEFPENWISSLELVDEIWAPSDFSLIAIRKITNKPTFVVPYALEVPIDEFFDREYFCLPQDQFLFFSMYDSNSTIDRKNPIGAIHAYKEAFQKEDPHIGIVIKINNPQPKDIEIIKQELLGYNNVYLMFNILSKIEVNSLLNVVDVFVSLHRSEGFGLPIAEAMYLATPTIATNWSSNLEFMTPETACLVGFDFINIEKEVGPYEKGNRWADPHINEAADYMIRLYEDNDFYQKISTNGQFHVRKTLSMEQATEKINTRISEIYAKNQKRKENMDDE